MYSFAFIIGRFQPFHLGHFQIVQQALAQAKNVIILLGSCSGERTEKNPFSAAERKQMISDSFDSDIDFVELVDYPESDEEWLLQVNTKLHDCMKLRGWDGDLSSVAMMASRSDDSSYYIDYFSQYNKIVQEVSFPHHATDIRKLWRESCGEKALATQAC